MTTVGEVGAGGVVLHEDNERNRVLVVSAMPGQVTQDGQGVGGGDALPVLRLGAVIVSDTVQGTGGVSVSEGPWPGVVLRVTEVQCLKSDETCIEGLDTDGDGATDLPVRQDAIFAWAQDTPMTGVRVYGEGETLEIMGTSAVVSATGSGVGVQTDGGGIAVDDGEPGTVSVHSLPGPWPWSADRGTVVAVIGVVTPDDLELRAQDDQGAWHEPTDVVVVQGRRGSVLLLTFPTGAAQGWSGEVGAVAPDGQVEPLPGIGLETGP